AEIVLDLDASFEHGVLVDLGPVAVDDLDVKPAELGYLRPGRDRVVLGNPGDDPARMLLIGGAPFGEDIIMWWNFVGRTHEEIVEAREAWQAHSDRFGEVRGYTGAVQHLPAPALPHSRLKPRVTEPASTDRSAWG
ncbi:MAG: pirin-like C-terminal cupin domain-containing protein, partial [Actinomycetes bacterium]